MIYLIILGWALCGIWPWWKLVYYSGECSLTDLGFGFLFILFGPVAAIVSIYEYIEENIDFGGIIIWKKKEKELKK